MRVLVVCTANLCRSPMAAGFLRVGAKVIGLGAQVASAGTQAVPGFPADPDGVATMADWGIDIAPHRSHRVAPIDLRVADLVLPMAREHLLTLVADLPEILPKTYTLRDLVRRGRHSGPMKPSETLPEWLGRLSVGRSPETLLASREDDDIADPIGQGRKAFRRSAEELDRLSWNLLDLLAGYQPAD